MEHERRAAPFEEQLERASWIRRMFEEGARLKAERGAENVFDFTLGNPDLEPPRGRARGAARGGGVGSGPARPRLHAQRRLSRTCGRRSRDRLARATGLPYTADHVLMTVGSSGAINTVLKAMLDPGDEVIVLVPYFPGVSLLHRESRRAWWCRWKRTATSSRISDRIAAAITPRTQGASSSTRPTTRPARSIPAETLRGTGRDAGTAPGSVDRDHRRAVPRHRVRRRGRRPRQRRSSNARVIADSWSKSMAIAGERIGYLAIFAAARRVGRAAQRLHVHQSHPRLHQRAGDLAAGRSRSRRSPGGCGRLSGASAI